MGLFLSATPAQSKCAAILLIAPLALVLAVVSDSATAAPVTFEFEAEVSTIYDTIPFDSGLDVQNGDTVTGRFTFEPHMTEDQSFFEVIQPYAASLWVESAQFATPNSIADLTLRARNNSAIADFPPATSIDIIELGSTLGPSYPGALPNVALDQSFFRMSLWGDDSVFQSANLPAEPSIWNSLQLLRSIDVGIRGKTGGSLSFQARVASFSVVPEPDTAALLLLLVACHGCIREREKRKSRDG